MKKLQWLSFCDPNKPVGTQFLGVIISDAPGFIEAVDMAHLMGINPGGEVMGYELPDVDAKDIKPGHINKLLSHEELIDNDYIYTDG